ncbi:hypothetical protein GCM10010156_26450 [Planobispora rosea]|uniref:Uncharacterized protein n=1 Tax=Planobispora rosea TaxID=35762 RepID=A0A8J3WEI8_PLARO|nr:hypothetical protein [Planobispora rosea]GGS66170.1 hypothetical protein GCM10010156_26450 [Planobispora rosea]GIH85006.1 hypothetical protein Pro02_34140 [Planobispora rosea]
MIAFDTVPKGDVSPGLIGFLVVAALGFALFLLIKSMKRQISKIEVPSEAELRKVPAQAEQRTPEGGDRPS